MTQSEASQMWPLIKAWAEGKILEFNEGTEQEPRWVIYDSYGFLHKPSHYRLKPIPHYHPWKPEEVPVGALMKKKNNPEFYRWTLVSVSPYGVYLSATHEPMQTFKVSFDDWEHSLDHGKTWLPCGVEEKE